MHIAEMTIGQILGGGIGVTAIVFLIIEIAPIKVNPWSYILAAVGNKINADLSKKVDKLSEELVVNSDRIDENERDRIRYEILIFANSCRNKSLHSHEEFGHIFEIYDKYHEILERRNETNGKIDTDMEYIKKVYHKCQVDNDFIA